MNVSSWSIRNPVPAILLFALLTLLGVGAFRGLGIQNFPDIEVPVITVTASQEGAAPAQLETEVARKIEDAVSSLGGVEHIHTTLTDGVAMIAVEFVIDKNPEVALNEVRNAVDTVRIDLPQDMTDPTISKKNTAGGVIIAFTIESETLDETDLSWFVDNDLGKSILSVPGVGRFSRVGGVDREIQIDLDPVRLAALGVTAYDVSNQLKRVRKDASGGRGDLGGAIQSFRTLAAATSLEDLARLEIPVAEGRRIPLSDIANIKDGIAERSMIALLDGKPVIAFEILRSKGWSEVTVANSVRRTVDQFQKTHPTIHIREAYDTVARVQDNFDGSMDLLYEGAFLAILVVFWFLKDWRATLVSAVALPLSIIPTFLIMKLAGFSLDILTLLALALVVGILVDDAIVEVENIVRHLRMGKAPYEASMEAADEIGLAVIATTLTLVAVFLPTAFMGGIPGMFFRPFGITACVAILASLMVARLLTPMMSAYLLRPVAPESEGLIMRGYLAFVKGCLRYRFFTILFSILFFVGSLSIAHLLPTGFVPAADRNQTVLTLELPPGSTLSDTRVATDHAIEMLKQVPEVTTVFAAVGSAANSDGGPLGGGSTGDVRKTTLTVNLVDRRKREKKQSVLEAELRDRLTGLPGVRVALLAREPGTKLVVTLASDNATSLATALFEVEKGLRTLKGVGGVVSSASLERPEIHIIPDFARCADLGITSEVVSQVTRVATAGDMKVFLPKLNLPERQVPIRTRLEPAFREDLEAIRQIPLVVRSGKTIPLSAVASVEMGGGLTQINRFDRMRRVNIDIDLGKRVIGDVLKEVNELSAMKHLPAGVQVPVSGDTQRMMELFNSFGIAMAIGVLCIYAVLVLLFHDFLQPITILAALPLSLGGALFSLLVTHNAFSMPAVIGILMLMGIVTKNSILLVEYAIVARREQQLNRLEALMDACKKRARPIVMTTIAMGAGMLPVALGLGAEPSFRAPMAIVVIGGLITSTFLSLLVIPAVFTYVDDFLRLARRLVGWLGRI
ncbi:Multidrug transporter MdtC [Gammaproteobacteria bacterium]